MTRGRALGPAMVSALLALTACGSGPGIAPALYADRVCGAISALEHTLTSQSRELQAQIAGHADDPLVAKQVEQQELDRAVSAGRQAVTAVDAAGFPRGRNGRAVAAAVRASLMQATALFVQARAALGVLRSNDRVVVTAALTRIGQQLQDGGNAVITSLDTVNTLGSGALAKAFGHEQACADL